MRNEDGRLANRRRLVFFSVSAHLLNNVCILGMECIRENPNQF